VCGELTTVGGRPVCITGDVLGVVNAVDVLTGDLIYRIEAHHDYIRAIAVMPEKSLLATGSGEWLDRHFDCSIKLWDLETGDARGTLSACE
jgi:WD40 repeat protein